MFEEVDGNSAAAEVTLLKSAADKAVLILEGGCDQRFFDSYVDGQSCEIVIANGKHNVLMAIEVLQARRVPGVLGIVDRDYDDLRGICVEGENVIVTDETDIETMLFRSRALVKIVNEMASRPKLRAYVDAGNDIAERIRDTAFSMGAVRLYSHINGCGFKFKGVSHRAIDRRALVIDVDRFVRDVLANSQQLGHDVNEVAQFVVGWQQNGIDRWKLCSGHDLAHVFGKALCSMFGNCNAGDTTGDKIESLLRMAYEADDLMRTNLYARVRTWEDANKPYRCFAAAA